MAADLAGSPVTVNLLLPGGATDTGMVPDDVPAELRGALLSPSIMGPPIVWLASPDPLGSTMSASSRPSSRSWASGRRRLEVDDFAAVCGSTPLQAIEGSTDMLTDARVATRLPAGDLDRAREFYAEKLGLEPADQRPGGLLYRCAGGEFALFLSAGASAATFTQIAFEVDDLDAVVAELRRRGVTFEEFDGPGLRTIDGIAEVAGNYPSKHSSGERAAWVRDSEGNLLGIGEATR